MTKGNSRKYFDNLNEEDEERNSQRYVHANDIDFTSNSGCTTPYHKLLPDKSVSEYINSVSKCTREKTVSKYISPVSSKRKSMTVNPVSKDVIKRIPENVGGNAARERSRVHMLKQAFDNLQRSLPNVPEGTKLSKLDILLLATNHISYLMSKLSQGYVEEHLRRMNGKEALHSIKKWPMRTRLFVTNHEWKEHIHEDTVEWESATNSTRYSKGYRSTYGYSSAKWVQGEENILPDSNSLENEEDWRIVELNGDRFKTRKALPKEKMGNYSINRKGYITERNYSR